MESFNFFILIVFALGSACNSQLPITSAALIDFREPYDSAQIVMTPSITMPSEDAGYTLLLPSGNINGLVVSFHSGRDTTHMGYEMRLYHPAIKSGLAAAFITTGNRFEFLFEEKRYEQLDGYLDKILTTYQIPRNRIYFVGMSLAGTRALKFGLWCANGNSSSKLRPRAVAICDAPLDFVRFWDDGQIAQTYQSNAISANEASWVNTALEENLGGTPKDQLQNYIDYSPFHKGFGVDTRLSILNGIALRCYTEPDVTWWMGQRQKSYYGMNALDASGIINHLQLLGHTEAELIVTRGRGFRTDGSRHPHTWGIVDNEELIQWLIRLP